MIDTEFHRCFFCKIVQNPMHRTLVFSKGRKPTREFIDEVCRDWGGESEGGESEGREGEDGGGGEGEVVVGGEGGGEGVGEGAATEADTGVGFNKIIAAHYDAPVAAGAAELRRAFAFLESPGPDGLGLTAAGAELPEEDMVGAPVRVDSP
jgi:hypothetical protein